MKKGNVFLISLGDGELPETDYDDPGSALDDRLDVKIMPTTVTMTATHVSTMTKYVTKPADNFGGTDEYGRPVVPGPNNLGPIGNKDIIIKICMTLNFFGLIPFSRIYYFLLKSAVCLHFFSAYARIAPRHELLN